MKTSKVIDASKFKSRAELVRFERALQASFVKAISETPKDQLEKAFFPEKVASLCEISRLSNIKAA